MLKKSLLDRTNVTKNALFFLLDNKHGTEHDKNDNDAFPHKCCY